MLDMPTLWVSMVAISTLMAVTTGMMAFAPGWRPIMAPLCLSQILKALGSFLLALRGSAGDWLSVIVANIFLLVVIALSLVVVDRLSGVRRSPRVTWASVLGVVVFACLITWFTIVDPSLPVRMVLMGIFAAFFCWVAAWRMFSSVEGEAGTVGAIILFFLGVAMGSRGMYGVSLPPGIDFLQLGNVNSVTILVAEMLQYAAIVAFSWVMTSRWQATAVAAARAGAKAERAREEADVRFQAVFRQAAVGIALMDLDGRIIVANDAFVRLFGYDASDPVVGLSCHDFSVSEDIQAERDVIASMLRGECTVSHVEKRGLHRSGQVIWVDRMLAMVCRAGGDPVSLVMSVVDVTERRHAQAALVEERAALRCSNKDLEQIIALVSSHIRGPARSISGYLGLLERRIESLLGEGEREYLRLASEGALCIDRSLEGLLDYISLTRVQAHTDQVSVMDVINDVFDALRGQIEAVGALVRVIGTDADVRCNRDMLCRVFGNLLDNALKYKKEGHAPEMRFSVCRTEQGVEVSIADNGIGIPDDVQVNLFDFQPGSSSVTECGRRGIGLAVSRKIVESFGGSIRVSSAIGRGSTFVVFLPLTVCDDKSRAAAVYEAVATA